MSGARGCARTLVDPRTRVLLGLAGIATTAAVLHTDRVGARESTVFRAVNRLPDSVFVPVWPVMQLGNLAAVPALSAAAYLRHDRRLARHLLITGSVTWALAKLVKRVVNRPRPAALLAGVLGRGREQSGLGYLSGHAAVAMALAAGLLPSIPRRYRPVSLTVAGAVAFARMYVGAHLPLDVLGGAALGLLVDAGIDLVEESFPAFPPSSAS